MKTNYKNSEKYNSLEEKEILEGRRIVGIKLDENGKMIEGKHYLTKIKYKYRGKWYWTKWRTGHGEAYYQKTAGIDLGVKIGKVKFKFPVS